jgi:outer membrane protein insertion porin family/translocation and assembly module TamA
MVGILAMSAACRPTGDVEVKDITFTGVQAFPESDLQNVLATRESGRFPWSPKHYFDRAAFDADLQRIHAYYVDRGYPAQRVTNLDVAFNDDRTEVRVRVEVHEGAPIRVESVRFDGFDVLAADRRPTASQSPLKAGAPRDRILVRATRDMVAGLLRDNGYPLGFVDAGERPGTDPNSVVVTFRADPGPTMAFGETTVEGLSSVNASVVRHQLTFKPGDAFRESLIRSTQRQLSSVEVFNVAIVTPRFEEASNGQVPVRITVAEGKPRRVRLSLGYGTEEQVRGSINWQHLNVFGRARRFEAEAKASALDQRLRLTFVQPYLARPGWSMNVSALGEATEQLTYDAQSYGGSATISYHHERGGTPAREPVRNDLHFTYRNEFLRYGISEESLSDFDQRDELIALGLDPETGRGEGTLGSLDFDYERVAVDDVFQPRRGTVVTAHFEHARPWLGGTYVFDEVSAEGRVFFQVGPIVLANRAGFGVLSSDDVAKVPFSKRYFLGGATSLRGWGRYEVSPLDEDGFPIGGRTRVQVSSEARFLITQRLIGLFFVDSGAVGSSDWNVGDLVMRFDVGPGLAYRTPIGPIRADVGYQLNPIEGLVINGEPSTRRWRLHISFGHIY